VARLRRGGASLNLLAADRKRLGKQDLNQLKRSGAAAGIEDAAAVAELRPVLGRSAGDKPAGVDDVAVGAHRVRLERVDKPALTKALFLALVVRRHQRACLRAVQKPL